MHSSLHFTRAFPTYSSAFRQGIPYLLICYNTCILRVQSVIGHVGAFVCMQTAVRDICVLKVDTLGDLAESPQAIVGAISALAQMMGVPAQQHTMVNHQEQAPVTTEQRQPAGHETVKVPKLQLEAMQALLMLLPLPMPQASCPGMKTGIALTEDA